MLSLNKLKKIAFLAFDNALRLHNDSIALYLDGRYPSAFQLSVLAQEEFGKMHMINHFVAVTKEYGQNKAHEEDEKKWMKLLYKHPAKQFAFFENSPVVNIPIKKYEATIHEIFAGSHEEKKQRATYVGLGRNKGEIDFKGKIKFPAQIKKEATKKQITYVNDYLVVTGIGIRYDQYNLDNEDIEPIFKNKEFIKKYHSNWKNMSKFAKDKIKSIQKLYKVTIIEV